MPAISGPVVATSPTGQQLAIGPPGPAGPTGPAGPPGPGGAGADGQFNVTLANGLNSNIPLSSQVTQRVGGPSAAFSIGGFAPSPSPVGGQRISVVNTTSQPMTFVHEDGSSSPSNRIDTQMGVPYTLPAKRSSASFVYDATSQRWVLQSAMPRPVLDVDVREFGAVCDGVSFPSIDDGPAINLALAYVSSLGGGTVRIPQLGPSTYTLIKTTVSIPANCRVTGLNGEGSGRSVIHHVPQASGSAIDPSTGVALSGTVSVTNGSASITFSVAQTLPAGTALTFGSQYAVPYTLLNPVSGSTSGTLTATYNGTTNASTSVKQCLGYILFACNAHGTLVSGVGIASLIISTPNAQPTTTIYLQDTVYADFENLLIGGANLDERNVAFHAIGASIGIVPTPGFYRFHNIGTTSLEANSGWSGTQSIGFLFDVAAGVTQGMGSGGSVINLEGHGDIEGRGTALQATSTFNLHVGPGWLFASNGNAASAGAATSDGAAVNLSTCQYCHFESCNFFSARPVGSAGAFPKGVKLDANCFENIFDHPLFQFTGQTIASGISDLGTNSIFRGSGGSSAIAPWGAWAVNPSGGGLPAVPVVTTTNGGTVAHAWDITNKGPRWGHSDGNWYGVDVNHPIKVSIDGAISIPGGGGAALLCDVDNNPMFFGVLKGNSGAGVTYHLDPTVLQNIFIPGASGFAIVYGCTVATGDYAPNGVAFRGESAKAGASVGHRNGADGLLQGGRPDATNGGACGSARMQVLQQSTGNPLDIVVAASSDGATRQLGFYGTTPVAQQTRATSGGGSGALSSGAGTASTGTADVGTSFNQGTLNNNFATIVARLNALEAIVHNLGLST